MNFKFSHIADVHVDAWREKELKDLNLEAFEEAIDISIQEDVDFILIAGDLFHTSHPSIMALKRTLQILKKAKQNNMPVYVIPGSHDFSQNEQTFLSVLEEAEFVKNIARARQEDNKLTLIPTKIPGIEVSLYGLIGRKLGLEKEYYENLNHNIELDSDRFNIFVFHSAISEYKPNNLENMPSIPLSLFPKKMDYYAGGHVHQYIEIHEKDYANVYYPGPIYPDNFKELEYLKKGSFLIVSVDNKDVVAKRVFLEPKKVLAFNIPINNLTPLQAQSHIVNAVSREDIYDKIILLRIHGLLSEGSSSDIDFKQIYDIISQKKPYIIKRNTIKLESKDFEEFKIHSDRNISDLENELINEHLGQHEVRFDEANAVHKLIDSLNTVKYEGETNYDFEKRIIDISRKIFDISQENEQKRE